MPVTFTPLKQILYRALKIQRNESVNHKELPKYFHRDFISSVTDGMEKCSTAWNTCQPVASSPCFTTQSWTSDNQRMKRCSKLQNTTWGSVFQRLKEPVEPLIGIPTPGTGSLTQPGSGILVSCERLGMVITPGSRERWIETTLI